MSFDVWFNENYAYEGINIYKKSRNEEIKGDLELAWNAAL